MVKRMPANQQRSTSVRSPQRKQGKGIALLICLFVLSIASVWTVDMMESASVYQSALRNSIEYEQALYQANAGVQHVLYQLEIDVNWRGTATAGSYPASGSYSATAVNGSLAGTVDVTANGVAGATTRKIQATILVN